MYTCLNNYLIFDSGNPIIQKIQRTRRRTTSSIGSLNRMPKTTPTPKESPKSGCEYF